MALDRRGVTFGLGAAMFGAPEAFAGEGNPEKWVTLAGEESSLRLRVVGYQFPDITDDEWDSNWLVVDGVVVLEGRQWRFQDPCLTTFEAIRLADWLDACANGSAKDSYCDFTEPNLQFELIDPETLRVSFALESAPPWSERGDDWTEHGFKLGVGHILAQAATDLRNQLQRFPVRGLEHN